MTDWKEEKIKRRDFRHCPDEGDYVPGSKPKGHVKKDFILQEFLPKGLYWLCEEGWRKRGCYKKLSDAEKAVDQTRTKESMYRNLALRIVHKDGTVLKEYPEIRN